MDKPSSPKVTPRDSSQDSSQEKIRVLFVDDSPDISTICKVVLSDTPYVLDFAESGQEALLLIPAFRPHVVFLDINMMDMSGIEVAKSILSLKIADYQRPLVYAFTNHHPDFLGDDLKNSGIERCIQKSGDIYSLKNTLIEAIEGFKKIPAKSRSNNKIRILLVEDNPSDVQLFKIMVSEMNTPCEIYEVEDGETALKYILEDVQSGKALPPDLIFLDLNLPKVNGKEVLKQFKSKPIVREIPVIILSTSRNQTDISECYDLHANCYLTKPSTLDHFKNIIEQIDRCRRRSGCSSGY
jgi:CheY-like chemotaxis protein